MSGARETQRPSMIFMTVAVWGQVFVDLFLEFALPSYLAPGGIPEIARRGYQAVFWVYTTSTWAPVLRNHAQTTRLADSARLEVVCIDEEVDISRHSNPYQTMTACHLDFIARSAKAQAAMIFFSPDALWSNRSLIYTLDQVEAGKRAILIGGVRAKKEAVIEELRHRNAAIAEGLTGRELVSLLVRHPHPITQMLTWNREPFDIGWASHLYWPVGRHGYLARCFHLHTFFVYPRVNNTPEISHDFDWLQKVGLRPKEVCIVSDSDDVCALELSAESRGVNGRPGKMTIFRLADCDRRYAASEHGTYVRTAIYFHAESRSGAEWAWSRMFSGLAIETVLLLARVQAWVGVELQSDNRWTWQRNRIPDA